MATTTKPNSLQRLVQRTSWSLRKRFAPPKGVAFAERTMPDVSADTFEIMRAVEPYTMLSPERLLATIEATRHVARHNIPGAIVECGVWRGGACMAAMLALQQLGAPERDFYLYDTFAGMNAPTEHDRTHHGKTAADQFEQERLDENSSNWCRCELSAVRSNVETVGYNPDRVHYVKGVVEDTIPATIPDQIAVLRLDTDWYVSTRHELEHLFPRLERGGTLLIDDYGHWDGVRQAVDEYFAEHNVAMFLQRTDYTGRAGVKV